MRKVQLYFMKIVQLKSLVWMQKLVVLPINLKRNWETVQKKVKTCETKDFLCIETQKPLCTNSFTKVLNCMIPGWWIAYLFIHSKHNYYSFLKSFYLNCKMNRCKETRYMETPVHLFVKLVYSAKNWYKWNIFPNKIRKQAATIQEIIKLLTKRVHIKLN